MVDFSFSQVDANSVLLNLNLLNSTGQIPSFGAKATQSTLMGITFDLVEGLNVVTKSYVGSSFFSNLVDNVSFTPFSNSGGNFNVGIAHNDKFEGGNTKGGLTQGLSSSVSFLLGGKNLVANNLENAFLTGFQDGTLRIASRFQAVSGSGFSGASDKLLGGILEPTMVVPAPGTAANAVEPVLVAAAPAIAVEPAAAAAPAPAAPAPESVVEPAVVPAAVPAAPAPESAAEPAASNPDSVSVPEPATLAGLGLVGGAMAMLRRRKVSKSA
jgi:hypothetical protein